MLSSSSSSSCRWFERICLKTKRAFYSYGDSALGQAYTLDGEFCKGKQTLEATHDLLKVYKDALSYFVKENNDPKVREVTDDILLFVDAICEATEFRKFFVLMKSSNATHSDFHHRSVDSIDCSTFATVKRALEDYSGRGLFELKSKRCSKTDDFIQTLTMCSECKGFSLKYLGPGQWQWQKLATTCGRKGIHEALLINIENSSLFGETRDRYWWCALCCRCLYGGKNWCRNDKRHCVARINHVCSW